MKLVHAAMDDGYITTAEFAAPTGALSRSRLGGLRSTFSLQSPSFDVNAGRNEERTHSEDGSANSQQG